ncbi:MAG: malonyl-ACP O-methyltransferase BioC [Prevotellaceae bacterium]|jgi:malonyl-ACP O-methyltransferase BioC|nr:malonyl-ACP O-methyltransferase BioC [Prevotellaceae bacterium]
MKVFWHKKDGNRHILLIFNGWSFDCGIFGEVDFPEHDIVSFYDYSDIRTEQFDFTQSYENVKLIAWSYGVFVADVYAANIYNLKTAVAINGSILPVDDKKGIPERIFLATLQSFNEKNREKFYIRAAGNISAYKNMLNLLPSRSIDNQIAELKSLYCLSSKKRQNGLKWNLAIISENDKIFPSENLKNAWSEANVPIYSIDSEHIPFAEISMLETLKKILGGDIRFFRVVEKKTENRQIDRTVRIGRKFCKSMDTYDENAFAQKEIAGKLHSMILNFYSNPAPRTILELGCGTGLLTGKIAATFAGAKYYFNDINEKVEIPVRNLFPDNNCEFIAGDAQFVDYPENVNLIVSSSTIQWFSNLQIFGKKAAQALSPSAYMFLSTFGENNLKEIREITGTGLKYYSPNELESLFGEYFDVIHISEDEIKITFDSPEEILTHLKKTGVNANSTCMFKTRKELALFCDNYRNLFSHESKVQLTYNPIYIVLRKKK